MAFYLIYSGVLCGIIILEKKETRKVGKPEGRRAGPKGVLSSDVDVGS